MSIRVHGLGKRFGAVTAVDAVGFGVEDGEFVSLLGPSGCGKTTTLRCIAGLEAPDAGEIAIDGVTVTAPAAGVMVPPHRRNVGMVFQSYAIWPHMTVSGNVAFPLEIRRCARREVAERVEWALDVVGLRSLRDRRATDLSGGQQQRVALARAIVGSPRILLFDEPLSNLDAKLRDVTRGELRRLQRRLNLSAVYVTHDQAEALSLSDRVIVMNEGRIVEEATPRDLYRRPCTAFVADFVGAANILEITATAGSGGAPAGRGPDGSVIRVPEAALGRTGRYRLMVRPEKIQLAPPATAAGWGPGWNCMRGEIRQALFMGAHTEYTVDVAGTELRVVSNEDLRETEVVIGFRPEDCALVAEDAPR